MEFDPALDGLVGTVQLSGDLGDGNAVMETLFDGGTLNGNGITRLLLGHNGFWIGKGIVMDDSTVPISEKI
jgi:hypothetical protein